LKHNVPAALYDESGIIRLINNECLLGDKYSIVSLIPFTDTVSGVVTEGLAYPLCNETLMHGSTRGISNPVVGQSAKVTVREGVLLVVQVNE